LPSPVLLSEPELLSAVVNGSAAVLALVPAVVTVPAEGDVANGSAAAL